jgi:hypothetical protein
LVTTHCCSHSLEPHPLLLLPLLQQQPQIGPALQQQRLCGQLLQQQQAALQQQSRRLDWIAAPNLVHSACERVRWALLSVLVLPLLSLVVLLVQLAPGQVLLLLLLLHFHVLETQAVLPQPVRAAAPAAPASAAGEWQPYLVLVVLLLPPRQHQQQAGLLLLLLLHLLRPAEPQPPVLQQQLLLPLLLLPRQHRFPARL